ncbi:MAG: hypothetical protein LBG96_03235 [Tannerella sp.]|jgi:hypothetical protein|nr:hypothetical protein [Tannerella sp.]
MKKLISLVLLPLMFTSCFSTRAVIDEPNLNAEFIGVEAGTIEFEMGEPDRVIETERGYDYFYTYPGH